MEFVASAPLRIEFCGGGTDIEEYFKPYNKGTVISANINLFVTCTITECEGEIQNAYGYQVAKILLNTNEGYEYNFESDVETGSGLGSSSAAMVAAIKATLQIRCFYSKNFFQLNPRLIIELAYKIERKILKQPGGWQDQIMAVCRGFRYMNFNKFDFTFNHINISNNVLRRLDETFKLVYIGPRTLKVIGNQIENIPNNLSNYAILIDLADGMKLSLETGAISLFCKSINTSYGVKKLVCSDIETPEVKRLYDLAMKSGAEGGRILGAGGGGHMLFHVKKSNHERFDLKMKLHGYNVIPFRFLKL